MKVKGGVILSWILRAILGIIFIITAYAKINDPYPFWEFIERVLSIPPDWAMTAQWVVVSWELLLGSSLLLFLRQIFPVWVTIGTLLGFTVVIGYASFFYPGIDCGCFGSILGQNIAGKSSLAKNGLLLLMTLSLVWIHKIKEVKGEN
ncbi:MAG TPA: MauE/DoxX family redox-associated membrane protein [Chitinophagaceae bacterium]|nr:MauE/DoxX family redox-associated membrane protein [Chitinophagaceae bacterium]